MDGFQLGKVMEKIPQVATILCLQEELQENWIQPTEFPEGGMLQAAKVVEENNIQVLGANWECRGIIPKDQGSESSKQHPKWQQGIVTSCKKNSLGIHFLQHKLQARMLTNRTKVNYKGLIKIIRSIN